MKESAVAICLCEDLQAAVASSIGEDNTAGVSGESATVGTEMVGSEEMLLENNDAVEDDDVFNPPYVATTFFNILKQLHTLRVSVVVFVDGSDVFLKSVLCIFEAVGLSIELSEVEIAQCVAFACELEPTDGFSSLAGLLQAACIAVLVELVVRMGTEQALISGASLCILLLLKEFVGLCCRLRVAAQG